MKKNKNIFTIGDIVEHKKWNSIGTIKSFRTLKQYILITINWNIKNNVGDDSEASLKDLEHYIQKAKQPLFTTEDAVDIFEGDSFFMIKGNLNNDIMYFREWKNYYGNSGKPINTDKAFKSEKKAQEYVDLHKPKYSLNDIKNSLMSTAITYAQHQILQQNLKQLNK